MSEPNLKESDLSDLNLDPIIEKNNKPIKIINAYKKGIFKLAESMKIVANDLGEYYDLFTLAEQEKVINKVLVKIAAKVDIKRLLENINFDLNHDKHKFFKRPASESNFKALTIEDLCNAKMITALIQFYWSKFEFHSTWKATLATSTWWKKEKSNEELKQHLVDMVSYLNIFKDNIKDMEIALKVQKSIKHIQDFHDNYYKVLKLDERENKEKVKEVYSANKNVTEEQIVESKETLPSIVWGYFFNGFGNLFSSDSSNTKEPLKTVSEEENNQSSFLKRVINTLTGEKAKEKPKQSKETEKTEGSQPSEENSAKQKSTAVSALLVDIDSKLLTNKLHEEFQSSITKIINDNKFGCFDRVSESYKNSSSCLIRIPNVKIQDLDKETEKCNDLVKKAKIAEMNCDRIFHMATDSDLKIKDLLEKSRKIEAEVKEDTFTLYADNDQATSVYVAGLKEIATEYTKKMLNDAYSSNAPLAIEAGAANMTTTGNVTSDHPEA